MDQPHLALYKHHAAGIHQSRNLPSPEMPTRKTTNGRQRVEMAKIKNKTQLQVTFSKRCTGLFKKASELCTLCGVEISIIIFSPAGKPFSFGHPSVESILNKFLTKSSSKLSTPHQPLTPVQPRSPNSSTTQLTMQIQWLLQQQETEKTKAVKLHELRQAAQNHFWWEAPVDDLGLLELQQLQAALQELKNNVVSTQIELLGSDPFPHTVTSWADVTSQGTSSAEASDDAYFPPPTSYQIPLRAMNLPFTDQCFIFLHQ